MPKIEYDAELHHAIVVPWGEHVILIGEIFNDRKQRFEDGFRIRTSHIVEELPDGLYRTKNTTYKVFLEGEQPIEELPIADDVPAPPLKFWRVLKRFDAWSNYETVVQARSAEEAADLVASRSYDGKLKHVGYSEFDDSTVEPEDAAVISDDEVRRFLDGETKLVVATAENGDPSPEDTKVISNVARDTILAALNLWIEFTKGKAPDAVMLSNIATNGGAHAGMTAGEIDQLIVELNS